MPNRLSRISMILYTLRFSPLSYPEKLRKVREIGYRSIQGGFEPGLTNEAHKALLEELGMEMSTFCGSLEDVLAEPDRYVEACRVFGCDEVMIGTMPVEYRADYDGYKKAIEVMNDVGRSLAAEGVFLAYHNHAQEFRRFPNGTVGMELLFDGLDPDAVHFLPDTHWIHAGGGDILAWIKKLTGRMQYLHVKDYRIAPAHTETKTKIGAGEPEKQFAHIGGGGLPWQLIVDTALGAGVKAFIVEQDFTYGMDPYECVARSYETLKGCGLS